MGKSKLYSNNPSIYNKVAMRALGFEVKKADVLKVMKEYDKEATGKITFDDFYEVSKYICSFASMASFTL
jgi:Ca2+-binding EF-hand superfamily protein